MRLQKCKAAQTRLRGVLQGRRGLSLGQRILLWKTTVLPCAMYGLGACGLSGPQLCLDSYVPFPEPRRTLLMSLITPFSLDWAFLLHSWRVRVSTNGR